MTILHEIIIATGASFVVSSIVASILAVSDPVYLALIALVSAIVVPTVTAVLLIWTGKAALAKVAVKVDTVDDKATKIGQATDGINTTLTKQLAAKEEENRGLRELIASQVDAKKQADTLALVAAKASPGAPAAPPAGGVNVGPLPLPVEVVADNTK